MTLSEILATSPLTLRHGARFHSRLAMLQAEETARRLLRDDWRCHVCGIRIPECMEVDHVEAHVPCAAAKLKTICQFCHDLRHPVWAGNRGRLQTVWAPDVSQTTLTRIAWAVFLSSTPDADAELQEAARDAAEAIARRESVLAAILGSAHAASLLEALRFCRNTSGAANGTNLARRLDSFVRFWPAAASRTVRRPEPCCSDLSRWDQDRFVRVANQAIAGFWKRCGNGDLLRDRYEELRLGIFNKET